MITSNKKLIIRDNLFCGLFLEGDGVDSSQIDLIAIEEGFRKQDKRHITILGGSTQDILNDILNKFSNDEKEKILVKIKKLAGSLDWNYTQKDFYKIKKQGYIDNSTISENRQSYICMIDIPDIKIFYKELNSLLKTNIPVQIPYITLFTKGERENPIYYGIPIPSIKEFNNLSPEKII